MEGAPVRLSGWKAIAAHFGRDRSTVIRWAAAEDFPVSRIPGKKGGSVYAYTHELDAWLERRDRRVVVADVEAVPPAPPPVLPRRRARPLAVAVALLASCASVGAALVSHAWPPVAPAPARGGLPASPAVANLYLRGREDWATRTPAGLRRAIVELGAVARRDPGFAPAHAALADTYLLSCEFDNLPRRLAFPRAEAEARAGLAADPSSPDANRALGFIDYWERGDLGAARAHFQRALTLAPASAQSHLWYGNVLMDSGQAAAGVRELQTARLLNPDSAAIQTDYAWALWQSGATAEGAAELRSVEARSPSLPAPPYFLAMIALADHDMQDYLEQAARWAALQNDSVLSANVAAQATAYREGGARATLELIAATPPLANAHEHDATLLAAGAASLARRRDKVLELLARAEAHGERWRPLRWQKALFAGWEGDRQVSGRLDRLFADRPPTPTIGHPA